MIYRKLNYSLYYLTPSANLIEPSLVHFAWVVMWNILRSSSPIHKGSHTVMLHWQLAVFWRTYNTFLFKKKKMEPLKKGDKTKNVPKTTGCFKKKKGLQTCYILKVCVCVCVNGRHIWVFQFHLVELTQGALR